MCALCPGFVDPDIDPYLCLDCAEDIPGQFEILEANRRMMDADPDRYDSDHTEDAHRWITDPPTMAATLALLVGKTVACGSIGRDATIGQLVAIDSSWCVRGDPVVSFDLDSIEMLCLTGGSTWSDRFMSEERVEGYIYVYGL
jgi:hypothetical protein